MKEKNPNIALARLLSNAEVPTVDPHARAFLVVSDKYNTTREARAAAVKLYSDVELVTIAIGKPFMVKTTTITKKTTKIVEVTANE